MPKDEKPEIKERLLAAGLKLFAEKGFNGSTFRDICDAAGCNISSINYYFSDKTCFYAAVRDYANLQNQHCLKDFWAIAEKDPWEALKIHIDQLLSPAYDDTMCQIHWFYIRELLTWPPIPQEISYNKRKPKCIEYNTHLNKYLSSLLGPRASTQQNISMLRYTYHSLCLHLPIYLHIKEKLDGGDEQYDVIRSIDKAQMAKHIYKVVQNTVTTMQQETDTQYKSSTAK